MVPEALSPNLCKMRLPPCTLNNASKQCLSQDIVLFINNQHRGRDNSQAWWSFKSWFVFHLFSHLRCECVHE